MIYFTPNSIRFSAKGNIYDEKKRIIHHSSFTFHFEFDLVFMCQVDWQYYQRDSSQSHVSIRNRQCTFEWKIQKKIPPNATSNINCFKKKTLCARILKWLYTLIILSKCGVGNHNVDSNPSNKFLFIVHPKNNTTIGYEWHPALLFGIKNVLCKFLRNVIPDGWIECDEKLEWKLHED